METSALVTMIIGMVIIWGGLVASVISAIRAGKTQIEDPPST